MTAARTDINGLSPRSVADVAADVAEARTQLEVFRVGLVWSLVFRPADVTTEKLDELGRLELRVTLLAEAGDLAAYEAEVLSQVKKDTRRAHFEQRAITPTTDNEGV